jgi:hypothetical protein
MKEGAQPRMSKPAWPRGDMWGRRRTAALPSPMPVMSAARLYYEIATDEATPRSLGLGSSVASSRLWQVTCE